MNLLELPVIKHILNMTLPAIATNTKIYLDPVVVPYTRETVLRERARGTLNRITLQPLEFVNGGDDG